MARHSCTAFHMHVTDSDGETLRRITSSEGNDHWPPAWSPEGNTLLYSADGPQNKSGVLMRVDLDTLETEAMTQPGSNALFPSWRG
jgi:Tol biopolymer transport system component